MTKITLIAPIIVYSYDNKKTNVQLTQVLLYKIAFVIACNFAIE